MLLIPICRRSVQLKRAVLKKASPLQDFSFPNRRTEAVMPARPSWEGFLTFNLISIPVKAYNAAMSGGGKIGFHLLHAKCGERIRYKKVCPVHGEVANDEIVSGYEYAKGEYVTVEAGEK